MPSQPANQTENEQISQKTRILCCASSLDGGGSERQLWQLVNNLDRTRFTPLLYLLYRRGPYLARVARDVPIEAFWDNKNPRARSWPGQIFRQQLRHLRDYVRAQRIDIVYDRTFHSTMLTGTALGGTPVKRVSVIVSPPSRDFRGSELRFQSVKRWLLRRAYRSAAKIVAVSEDVADDAAKFYRLERECFVVSPNPVDCEAVRSAAEAPLGFELPSDPQVINIAVIGRLSKEKGQRLAIEALAKLAKDNAHSARFCLHVVGEGPDQSDLQQLAVDLGVGKAVAFHGFLSNPYPLIRRCELVCIPSLYEGLPNVALESLVLETPVLATDCSRSLRKLFGDNERGTIVAQGNVGALAAAMRDRLVNPQIWNERASAGKQWVEQHHSLQPWLESTQTMLEAAVGKRAVQA